MRIVGSKNGRSPLLWINFAWNINRGLRYGGFYTLYASIYIQRHPRFSLCFSAAFAAGKSYVRAMRVLFWISNLPHAGWKKNARQTERGADRVSARVWWDSMYFDIAREGDVLVVNGEASWSSSEFEEIIILILLLDQSRFMRFCSLLVGKEIKI